MEVNFHSADVFQLVNIEIAPLRVFPVIVKTLEAECVSVLSDFRNE